MAKSTDEMILEIWQTIPAINDLKHTIYGNGQPGLLKEFTEVKTQQEQCPARLNSRRDNRAFALSVILCGIAFMSGIVWPVLQWLLKQGG